MKLAIADPDLTSADVLSFAASRRGHRTVCVNTLSELAGSLPFEPNVVILGSDSVAEPSLIGRLRGALPDVGLFVILERPREPLPSNMLVAGANEVIRAPYNPTEVVIRAENWLNSRGQHAAEDDSMKLADLVIELDRYTATKNGHRLNFTKLELRLLYCLCKHSPHLTPTERLLTFGWDTLGDPDAALIKTHISHIRKKLQDAGGTTFVITARQSLGYTLVVDGAEVG